MNWVLRGDLDEREPTPGAGPCLEDLGMILEEDLIELMGRVTDKEYDFLEVLFHRAEDVEAWLLTQIVGSDCLRVVEVGIAGCGSQAGRLLELADEPEVERVELIKEGEADCVAIHSSSSPPLRVMRLLEKLGMRGPFRVMGYRPVGEARVG